MMSFKSYIFILLVCCSTLTFAQNDSIFKKANDAYADANYQEAKRLYLNIIKNEKESSELYYNLGNTFYKLENIPQSIYYFEKALKLDPDNKDIQNNLSFANRMKLDQFQDLPESEVDQGIEKFVTLFSVDTWSILGIGLLLIASLAFALFIFNKKPHLKRLAFGLCLLLLILSIGTFTMAQTELNTIEGSAYAIIFEKEKQLLEEPNPKSNVLFDLHEGTKIEILDQFRSYYKVKLPDGTIGWMTTENIKEI